MKKKIGFSLLCSLLMGIGLIAATTQPLQSSTQEEIATINRALEELIDFRDKELAKATWHQNKGDRLQFRSNNLMDAKRSWAEADKSREIAAQAQEKIDQLEKRKEELLGKQGARHTPSRSEMQEGHERAPEGT